MLLLGLAVALLVFVADQASKWWLIGFLAHHPGGVRIAPFFNLVMVWNHGVSFGLLGGGRDVQRWVLAGIAAAVALALAYSLRRAVRVWHALALGLIIGGALGNAADRVRLGAVADFFDFHIGAWHWPAFNLADSAISVGVVLLLLDVLFNSRERVE